MGLIDLRAVRFRRAWCRLSASRLDAIMQLRQWNRDTKMLIGLRMGLSFERFDEACNHVIRSFAPNQRRQEMTW